LRSPPGLNCWNAGLFAFFLALEKEGRLTRRNRVCEVKEDMNVL